MRHFVFALIALTGCYGSHLFEADDDGPAACEPIVRCERWVTVTWQADLPPGVIREVHERSDLHCYGGTDEMNRTIIGPLVDPQASNFMGLFHVCDGCFFVDLSAHDASGRVIAEGHRDFCVDGADLSVDVPLDVVASTPPR